MLGISGLDDFPLEYCWQLVHEYAILHNAQIHVLLKKHTSLKRRERYHIAEDLRKQWCIWDVYYNDTHYIANDKKMIPKGRYMKQIACFWVLLDYFDKVSSHYATGTFTRISMEIAGQDYSIVYVGVGEEGLCRLNIEKSSGTRYIVVVEDISQLALIKSSKIRTFAIVDDIGNIRYYTPKKEAGRL